MKKKYKVLIAHSAQQHSFRTATALKESGYLYKYITTVYDKEGSITRKVKKLLRGDNLKRASTRRCKYLNDDEVIQYNEFLGLILLFLQRVDKKKYLYNLLDDYIVYSFNKKVARYALKNNIDAIIMYDTLAYKTFEILKKKAPKIKCIIDMSAPNIAYMDSIFKEEISKNKLENSELINEINSKKYNRILERGKKEIFLSDYFLVASEFTAKSLIYSKINNDRIFYCVYGIDNDEYRSEISTKKSIEEKIECVFMGGVNSKKGAPYLFDAIDKIDKAKFNFKFIGNVSEKSFYYKKYKKKCNFLGHITKDKVIKNLQESDVIIFPSLADGFGLSVLEALACGATTICSKNAGVSDIIENGYNGFVIKAMNTNEIYDKLIWFDNNRDKLHKMKNNSQESVTTYTWDRYNNSIEKAISKILIK